MGHDIPEGNFEIDPLKTYKVTVDWWYYLPGPESCSGSYQGKDSANRGGQQIIDWLAAGRECTNWTLVRPPLSTAAERIFTLEEV